MIFDYNYLKNENQILLKAQSTSDEKFLLKNAIHISRDKETKCLIGLISIDNLIINLQKIKER